jgi:hypothetical protein
MKTTAKGLAKAARENADDELAFCSSPLPYPRNCRPFLRLGGFTLRHHAPGKVWIENAAREGMATDEAKLESMLEKFWRKEF